jgi:hypothetical protein
MGSTTMFRDIVQAMNMTVLHTPMYTAGLHATVDIVFHPPCMPLVKRQVRDQLL